MMAPQDLQILAPNGRPAWMEVLESAGRKPGGVKANWYEGSRWSPNRSYVWFPVQDAKRDLDKWTRYELIKRSRYLWKNLPLARGLIERIVNLVIGSGIHPVPQSSKEDWNQKAKASWRAICRHPCADSKMSMSVYQRIKCRERVGDGEGFTLKSFNKRTGKDGIVGIEADRVDGGSGNDQGTTWGNQGIKTDESGMPVAFQIRGVPQPYPADYVVHHVTFNRSGQLRGEPMLAPCVNTAQDIDDILALEKDAVKDASAHKDIIKTTTGELDPATLRKIQFGNGSGQTLPTLFALPGDDRTRDDYYKIQFQGQPVVLRTGDEYTPYKPDRPGSAWAGFMAFLANSVVLATGLPPSLLLPVEIGGTDIRRDLELAQRIVECWQQDIANEWQEIWEYFIEGQIEDGPLSDAPADWQNVRWHFPKSITVDRGRDAQQDRSDVQSGLMSHEEYHARYGDDSEEYETTVINEVRRRRLLILGTSVNEPFKNMLEFVQLLSLDSKLFTAKITEDISPDDTVEPQPDPEPPPKAKKKGAKAKP